MLGNYLVRNCRNGESIVDIFPQSYNGAIPETLLSAICAYVSLGHKDPTYQ